MHTKWESGWCFHSKVKHTALARTYQMATAEAMVNVWLGNQPHFLETISYVTYKSCISSSCWHFSIWQLPYIQIYSREGQFIFTIHATAVILQCMTTVWPLALCQWHVTLISQIMPHYNPLSQVTYTVYSFVHQKCVVLSYPILWVISQWII